MDHESLRTASTYLNNLLLARGLLRNGDPVDFVRPTKESRAQIINLVHDLILREDREKEQREHVGNTLRQLRSEDARKTHEIERLTAKTEEAARATTQAQTAERMARVEVKKVEKAMRALQDQTAKLKITLAQVKTQCTNDVKKRDLELARLKTHLQGQQRGTRIGMTAPSMTIKNPVADPSVHDLGDPEYSLKQETTEFLTQLSQSLSDENDGLIGLIRDALSTMHELLGLPANIRRQPDSALGSMGSDRELIGKHKSENNMLQTLPTSYETLAGDMETTLAHLKTLLTNPNFVSMEEVEVREEEIARLRDGWEHMENRWRDVMYMMQSWQKRMDTGDSIKIEDLRKGLGLVSPDHRHHGVEYERVDLSLVESDASELRLAGVDGPSAISLTTPQLSSPGKSSPKRKRDILEPPEFFDLRPPTAGKSARASPQRAVGKPESASNGHAVKATISHEDGYESSELEVPRMTVEEKLSAAQRDAEEARAGEDDTVTGDISRRAQVPAYGLDGSLDELAIPARDDDTLGVMPSPMGKRTRIRGRPRKRKSTLSPEELETLICADEG